MEKTKLNLSDLWNEIVLVKYEAEKISLLEKEIQSLNDKKTPIFLDMMNDYTNKVIGNLENIESALREEINDYGQSAGF